MALHLYDEDANVLNPRDEVLWASTAPKSGDLGFQNNERFLVGKSQQQSGQRVAQRSCMRAIGVDPLLISNLDIRVFSNCSRQPFSAVGEQPSIFRSKRPHLWPIGQRVRPLEGVCGMSRLENGVSGR
jgi:hypothetical protein